MEDILNTHHKSSPNLKNRLLAATVIILLYGAVEAACGWWSDSLTLLSDAGHTVADAVALGLSTLAAWISNKPSSHKHTYGFGRAEVIAAWFSSLLLIIVIISILLEVVHRFNQPHPINGQVVMLVALGGFFVNLIMALLLSYNSKNKENINIKSSLLHIIGDLLGCFIVLISGALVHFTKWQQIDSLASTVICSLILFTTINLLRESLLILMEGVPEHIDIKKVSQVMTNVAGVKSVHDIHIWTLTSSAIMLTAHIVVRDLHHWPQVGKKLQLIIKEKFAITHATLQPEDDDYTNSDD